MAIAFIDAQAHPAAIPWYSAHRPEPSGSSVPLQVTQAVSIPSISLHSLLDSILANAQAGGDIIVVGHGREGGLSMRLVAGSQSRARSEAAGVLARDRATSDDLVGTIAPTSASSAASVCQISEAQVTQLRAKMNGVRALNLNHVAFRACKLGAWPDTLRAYKPFFGCRIVSAPDLRDTCGTIRPGAPSANISQWITQHSRNNHHMYVYNSAPNQVAIATSGGQDDDHSYTLEFAYENAQALTTWSTQYLSGAGSGTMPYHGQWRTYAGPGEPQILFIGDRQYSAHLIVV